jgi:hypothetical protein
MISPTLIAYVALLIWPLVTIYLYSNYSVGRATLWTILGAYLLLPVGAEIKFSGIPAFDKNSIPNLAALICCVFLLRRWPKFFRGFGVAEVLIVVLLVSPFVTSMLNHDPIRVGITVLPGVGAYDALSAAIAQFIFIIPFFLGRDFLRTPENNAEIFRVMVIAGLAYSLPMLFEIRMSPQLHFWLYGYYPTDFIQEVREGGFRPMVFLGHGLLVAFFTMTAAVAAAALWRTKALVVRRLSPGLITGYLSVLLVLCKTASALMYCALLISMVRWARPRVQLRVASILVMIALTYPVLRAGELIPTASILNATNAVSAERANSLKTRFDNEDRLLDHAWQRPWFGWGRFGRSRVYNDWGSDSSTTDGHWIITMGTFGIVGFVAEFGLLAYTVLRATFSIRFAQTGLDKEYLAALALIVAIGMIDLLPNSSISPWSWLLAGALLGRAEALYVSARQRVSLQSLDVHPVALRGRHTSPV